MRRMALVKCQEEADHRCGATLTKLARSKATRTGGSQMSKLSSYIYGSVAFGAISLAATGAFAACSFTPPLTTQTKCVTAVQIPGSPLLSYDISWVNPNRAEYYLADRSNFGIDIIDTQHLTFKRRITGFVGFTGSNDTSGPDGVVSHGRWLYAGDGNSTLKVIDL